MIYLPVSLFLFLLLLLLLPFIWIAVAVEVIEIAVAKLGFSPGIALMIFAAVLFGSMINIPLYRVESTITILPDFMEFWLRQFWGLPLHKVRQQTIVALNVGGGLIPVLVALYQLIRSDTLAILAVTVIVTIVSYYSAHIVPGIGIQINALNSPLTAVLTAVLIAEPQASSVALAGGILGTLIGADLLHLKEIERMSPGVLSIGGAGVFDGIAMCGLFALLLT